MKRTRAVPSANEAPPSRAVAVPKPSALPRRPHGSRTSAHSGGILYLATPAPRARTASVERRAARAIDSGYHRRSVATDSNAAPRPTVEPPPRTPWTTRTGRVVLLAA